MADERSFETETEQRLKQDAEKAAKKVGKKAAKETAKAAAKAGKAAAQAIGAGLKALGAVLAPFMPYILAVLGIVLAVVLTVTIMFAFIDKIKQTVEDIKKGIVGVASKLLDIPQYNKDEREDWNYGGDPDMTYLLYEKLLDNKNGDQTQDYDLTENLNDLMREDTIFFSPNDLLDILQKSYEYNDKIFQFNIHSYERHEWSLDPKHKEDAYGNELPEIAYYYWGEHVPVDNTTDDSKYAILTNHNVRGEKHDGDLIYTVHWQDAAALMYMWGQGKYDNEDNGWGVSGESKYIYNEGSEYEVNSTKGYYFTMQEIDTIMNVLKYNFNYYGDYDAVENGEHQYSAFPYEWEKLKNGAYNIGYRYSRVADPDDLSAHYNSPDDYAGENPTPTIFAPDSAPNAVYNFTELYKYAYISTTEVDDYTPDPENFEPPEGIYCVGKWQITDPRPFINALSVMYPWFKTRSYNPKFVDQFDYNWVDDMMDIYLTYLELIDMAVGSDRCAYYDHLRDLYNQEKIEVHYYGMKLSDAEMDEFITSLETANPGMTIELIFDSGCHEYGDFYDVSFDDLNTQAETGSIPFPSYGVSYATKDYKNDVPEEWKHSGNIPGEFNYSGTIFISEHGTNIVNDWIYLVDGADEPLDSSYVYTRAQIEAMLAFMNTCIGQNKSNYDFLNCVDDLVDYNTATGADIAGLLAIIMVENSKGIGVPTYNWFNISAASGESTFQHPDTGDRNWWNTKAEFATSWSARYHTIEGCCMVECMNKIYENYWTRSDRLQNTYFRMSFNQYGWNLAGETYYPQNREEALVQENIMDNVVGHCYCPWWDDTGYRSTHNPARLWCNLCAQNRAKLRMVSGIPAGSTPRTEMNFADLPTELSELVNMDFEEIFKYIVNDGNASYSEYKTFSDAVKAKLLAAQAEMQTTITVPVRQWANPSDPNDMTTISTTMDISVNKVIAPLVQAAMTDAYNANDGTVINSWDGTYNVRSMRGSSSTSAHAFGCALDFNSTATNGSYSNQFGYYSYSDASAHDSMSESHSKYEVFYEGGAYVNAFKHYGFNWGGDFSKSDGMHFSFVGDYGEHGREKGQENAARY